MKAGTEKEKGASLSMVLEEGGPPRTHHKHPHPPSPPAGLHAPDLAPSSVHVLINYDWAGGWRATGFHLLTPAFASSSPGNDISNIYKMTFSAAEIQLL